MHVFRLYDWQLGLLSVIIIPDIFVWLVRHLEQSPTGHSFHTNIINFHKHAQGTFFSRSYFTH